MEGTTIRKTHLEDGAQVTGLLKELGYPNKPALIRLKIELLSKNDSDPTLHIRRKDL